METVKILVAEDEKLIREGIIRSLNWEAMGASISGQARNGVMALKLLKEDLPDILITDIKMGGGDGLTLIREAKAIHPDLNVVIISGFNNFEYARRAIKLGVQDYLLKPIVIEDLEKVIKGVIQRVRKRESEKQIHQQHETNQLKNHQILVDQFYRELVYGVIHSDEISQKLLDFEMERSERFYCSTALFLELNDSLKWGEIREKLNIMLDEYCRDNDLSIESILLTPNDLYNSDITVIFSSPYSISGDADMMGQLTELIKKTPEMALLALGMGPFVNSFEELNLSYQAGRTQAYFTLISGLNSKTDEKPENRHDIPLNIYEATKELYRIFSSADYQEMNNYLNRIDSMIRDENLDMEKRVGIMRNLLVCILSAGDELGIAVKELFPDLMVLFRYINLKSLEEMLAKFKWACETIIAQQQTREDKMSIDLMERAKNTIIKNFTDPLLSLETISAELSITPAYFSKLYKKYHGVSYIEFLTSLRMENARELLKSDRSFKISAVAFKVGYNSSSYFNYIFKKTYGITPREYQKEIE